MPLAIDTVRFGADRQYSGYLAYPERAARPLPGIVVIHEAGGLDPATEDIARRFAAAGYAAFAPDAFSLHGVRPPALTRERVGELYAFGNTVGLATLAHPARRDAALEGRPEPERSRLRESTAAMFAAAFAVDTHLPAILAASRHLREVEEVTASRSSTTSTRARRTHSSTTAAPRTRFAPPATRSSARWGSSASTLSE